MLHVVENDLIEGGGPPEVKVKWSKSTSITVPTAALDAGDDNHHLVEVAVKGAVAARAAVEETAERGADERPLVVKRRAGERRVEPDRVLERRWSSRPRWGPRES